MASDDLKLRYARLFLQRTYPAGDPAKLAALKTLADQIYSEATDTVTITTGGMEGGQAGGQITFEKVLLGVAIEERLSEIDADYVPPPARALGFVQQFSPL